MKSLTITILCATAMVLSNSCSHQRKISMESLNPETKNIIESPLPERNVHFAFDLLNVLPEYEENFVISPFSISTALAMTYAGAREQTQEEMVRTLYFDPDQNNFHSSFSEYLSSLKHMAENNVELNIANSIWAQRDYQFRKEFFQKVENSYDSELVTVDFITNREQIREDINQWVLEETRDNIKNLIAPGVLTRDTRMVLVNAIHFFGPWLTEFDKQLTREDKFYPYQGPAKTARFMYTNERMPYYEDDFMQAIEIPYSGKTYSMVIMLPKKEHDLKKTEGNLNAEKYQEIIQEMKVPDVDMDILVPRFKAETKTDLESTLTEMGMPLAFSDQADFSGMTGKKDLKIDKVIHQAMIDVAEEGTEAAAATAVVIVRKTSIEPEDKIRFKADRPFLFFVKDNRYNSILFMGRMNNPE